MPSLKYLSFKVLKHSLLFLTVSQPSYHSNWETIPSHRFFLNFVNGVSKFIYGDGFHGFLSLCLQAPLVLLSRVLEFVPVELDNLLNDFLPFIYSNRIIRFKVLNVHACILFEAHNSLNVRMEHSRIAYECVKCFFGKALVIHSS